MDQESIRDYIASSFEEVEVTLASKENGAPLLEEAHSIPRNRADRVEARRP